MATVNGLSAERMAAIEAASVVDGSVNGSGHLILERHDGTTFDAGNVKGADGQAILDNTKTQVSIPTDFSNGVTITNSGGGVNWFVANAVIVTNKVSASFVQQILTEQTTGKTYIRAASSSSTWGAWNTMATSADLAAFTATFSDTGWLDLPFDSLYQHYQAPATTYRCSYRKITQAGVSTIWFRGLVERIAGNLLANTTYAGVFTLPSGSRPPRTRFVPAGTTVSTTGAMWAIQSSGDAELRIHTVALAWVSLDGLSILID